MNTFSQAVEMVRISTRTVSFILEYSPTHGFSRISPKAAVEKLTGISSEGNDLAQVLEQIDPHGSELFYAQSRSPCRMDALAKSDRRWRFTERAYRFRIWRVRPTY